MSAERGLGQGPSHPLILGGLDLTGWGGWRVTASLGLGRRASNGPDIPVDNPLTQHSKAQPAVPPRPSADLILHRCTESTKRKLASAL